MSMPFQSTVVGVPSMVANFSENVAESSLRMNCVGLQSKVINEAKERRRGSRARFSKTPRARENNTGYTKNCESNLYVNEVLRVV